MLSGLAARGGRRVFRGSLGERRGLSLVGPQGFLELGGQLADLGVKLVDLGLKLGNTPILLGQQVYQLFVGGPGHPCPAAAAGSQAAGLTQPSEAATELLSDGAGTSDEKKPPWKCVGSNACRGQDEMKQAGKPPTGRLTR
jgi:hypothetical protein